TGEGRPDILDRDDLGYEANFDSWMRPHPFPVLAVRFEKLWTYTPMIEEFIGRPIHLPPLRQRTTEIPDEERARLERTYSSLVAKVRAAPDLAVW
ncbi:MAG TPA: hypothetical protein VKA55_01435, partial [Gammaproteobacteria bacterium]|nr:hypothetical protein [Gammaproteobacteria bacterium]